MGRGYAGPAISKAAFEMILKELWGIILNRIVLIHIEVFLRKRELGIRVAYMLCIR